MKNPGRAQQRGAQVRLLATCRKPVRIALLMCFGGRRFPSLLEASTN